MLPTLARYPRKHATYPTHATHASTPPTPTTLYPTHASKQATHATHASTYSTPFLKLATVKNYSVKNIALGTFLDIDNSSY